MPFDAFDDADRLSKTQELSSVFSRIIKRADPEGKHSCQTDGFFLLPLWKKIAGNQVAALTQSLSLRGGELFISVNSPLWAQELNLLSDSYLEKFNEARPTLKLSRVYFRVDSSKVTKR